ncbi:MAG: hypothetical protein A2015_01350 [Spirochaetes bacterium GWF1_31_7]|nr:MAG: hypothetical protein A2Y30_07940 [Spirochaetes bacterium GWE1_32_154]OHD47839.1 MAG: hypothetical protein A2015_01350 [Spirochaetes bacterium GWF1_31_7]OHD52201.1 MAG: hypothetical protein A2Y29_17585 [Spirochaetes bacterium GWE2_31_10]HBD93175.1 hypothetical protein [Spirochaetia bacterium]HBI36360.1 hypothetical protein [Spirochaetia bacterium]
MKNKILYALLVLIAIFLLSCRTMSLNQTAENLKKGKGESLFTPNVGGIFIYNPSPYSMPYIGDAFISLGYQQRFGLTDLIELQFKHDIILMFPLPEIISYTDFGVKFNLYEKDKFNIAIIPYSGWFGGNGNRPITGPTTGFKFLVSGYNDKFKNSPYFGSIIQFKKDIVYFEYNQNYEYLFDLDLGLSFGCEINRKVITRHEFSISSNISFNNNASLGLIGVSCAYNISVGGDYFFKKK